jgi:serine/threonine-protein kinase
LHALEKLPADRFASAQDFADALSGRVSLAASGATVEGRAPGALAGRGWRAITLRVAPWGVAAASLVVAAIALTRPNVAPMAGPVTRTNLDLPGLQVPLSARFAIAPDGATIAVVALDSTLQRRIYVRRSDDLEARALAGTEGAGALAFSPDGRSLAFIRGDSLIKVPVGGGPPLVVARAQGVSNPSWASDGQIMFNARGSLYRVSGGGGEPKLLLAQQADTSYHAPIQLPGGNAVLFFANYASDVDICVLDVRSGRVRILVPRAMNPRYVESGHLLYTENLNDTDDRTIFAVPFSIARLEVTGEPVPVLQGVASFDVSPNGALVYRLDEAGGTRLFVVEGVAPAHALSLPGGAIRSVRLSPDARRVVYGLNASIYVHDLSIGTNRRVVPPDWRGADPFWSPDGRRIAFHSSRPTTLGFDGFTTTADSIGAPKQLFRDSVLVAPQAWLSDGRMLARGQRVVPGGSDIFVLSFKDTSVKVTPYLNAEWDEFEAAISPDERWVAFRSNETGRNEVYVRPFPDASGGKWLLSEHGGIDPVWARDGRSVYWWEGSLLRVAHVRTQPGFAVLSRETVLKDDAYMPNCCFPNYDIYPDGKRFIMARRGSAQQAAGLVLVTNWFEELKARMGASAGGARKP